MTTRVLWEHLWSLIYRPTLCPVIYGWESGQPAGRTRLRFLGSGHNGRSCPSLKTFKIIPAVPTSILLKDLSCDRDPVSTKLCNLLLSDVTLKKKSDRRDQVRIWFMPCGFWAGLKRDESFCPVLRGEDRWHATLLTPNPIWWKPRKFDRKEWSDLVCIHLVLSWALEVKRRKGAGAEGMRCVIWWECGLLKAVRLHRLTANAFTTHTDVQPDPKSAPLQITMYILLSSTQDELATFATDQGSFDGFPCTVALWGKKNMQSRWCSKGMMR